MIQDVQAINDHPKTGAVRFGSDWPGIFIAGDEALGLAELCRIVENSDASNKDEMTMSLLRRISGLLESCRVKAR
jgi:hypothetical protein